MNTKKQPKKKTAKKRGTAKKAMTTAIRLKHYMQDADMNVTQAAQVFGVSGASIAAWLKADRVPILVDMFIQARNENAEMRSANVVDAPRTIVILGEYAKVIALEKIAEQLELRIIKID